MKRIKISAFIATIMLASCNGTTTQQSSDTTQGIVTDTMPVVKPTIVDTEGVMRTPPINDDNVIVPDTNRLPK